MCVRVCTCSCLRVRSAVAATLSEGRVRGGCLKGTGRTQGVLILDWATDILGEGFVRLKTQTLGKVQMKTYCVLVRCSARRRE